MTQYQFSLSSAFLSVDEIVDDLINRQLDAADQAEIKQIAERDLVLYHHSMGQFIRNFYELWNPNNPHTLLNYQEMLEDHGGHSVDVNPKHPDNVSMEVIKRLWERLTSVQPTTPVEQHRKMLRSL